MKEFMNHSFYYIQRLTQLSANQRTFFKQSMSEIIKYAITLHEQHLCPNHFYNTMKTYIKTRIGDHTIFPTTRESLDIALITLSRIYIIDNIRTNLNVKYISNNTLSDRYVIFNPRCIQTIKKFRTTERFGFGYGNKVPRM